MNLKGVRPAAMDKLLIDVRSAWRSLRAHQSGSMAIAVVTALGVGLASSVFALADPYSLRPLPYGDPHDLVAITWSIDWHRASPADEIPRLDEWQRRRELFRGLAAIHETPVRHRLSTAAGPVELAFLRATPDLADVLRIPGLAPGALPPQPMPGDEASSETVVVVTTAGARKIGGPGGVLPRAIRRADGGSLRIAGVLPPTFVVPGGGMSVDVDGLALYEPGPLVAVAVNGARRSGRNNASLVVARLEAGVTAEQVRGALGRTLSSGTPFVVVVEPLTAMMTKAVRPLALGALAAALLILIVCAGNVTNLLATRWGYRLSEFGTRTALGASRFDIARLMGAELAFLGLAGLTLGLGIAHAALAGARLWTPAEYTTLGDPSLSARAGVFALLAAAGVVGCGLIPSFVGWLRVSGQPRVWAVGYQRLMPLTFVAVQCAVAMVLASGAALLGWSYINLVRQETGYDGSTIFVELRGPRERNPEPSLTYLRRIPGVVSAAAIHGPLVEEGAAQTTVRIEGETASVDLKVVTSDFFGTVGTAIAAGRGFEPTDSFGDVVVVDDAFARQHWPGRSPIGAVVSFGQAPTAPQAQVVGVVQPAFDRGLAMTPTPTLYAPALSARSVPLWRFVLRVEGDFRRYEKPIRLALAETNRGAVVTQIATIGTRLADSIRERTFAALVFGLFGIGAVAISMVGITAVIGDVVARRTREIAVRMAVGASRGNVWLLVVRDTLTAAGIGLLIGLVVGRWLVVSLNALVYGVSPGSLAVPLVAACMVVGIALGATILPTRRAYGMNPAAALRSE
jgi:predicted permease